MLGLGLIVEDGLFAAEVGWDGVVEGVVRVVMGWYSGLHYGFE